MIFILTWGVTFALLWLGAHELFYPPGDWIGAALVSFFLALGVGAVRKYRFERRDAGIVAKPEGAPVDGKRVAVAGTIEPIGEGLNSPFTGVPCVAYDYSMTHVPKLPQMLDAGSNTRQQPSRVMDRSGFALAPSIIRSGVREIRLLAFPGFERFPASNLGEGTVERARSYFSVTKLEEQSVLNAPGQTKRLLEDRTGNVRVDWKLSSHDDLNDSGFMERVIPVGAQACVIGLYSAKDNAIVPQQGVGGTRLIKGTRAEALEFVRDTGTGSIIAAAFFLLVPGPVAYGILSHAEHYNEENHKDNLRAERIDGLIQLAREGNPDAVRAALRHRVDVNGQDKSGNRALVDAANPATMEALIAGGANVELPGYLGLTPLMRASADGNAAVVQALLSHHADVKAKNPKDGKTALDYAVSNGHDDIAQILRKAGG
jgi:hypothetical protein